MNWNEYAQVGARLQDAFWTHKYDDGDGLTDASFVFEILDKVRMADGYSLKVLAATDSGLGDVSRLVAVPDGLKVEPARINMVNEWFDFENYVVVEPSEMGVFQAQLLKFASSWMPVFWHGGYEKRIFAFCDDNVRSFGDESDFNPDDFANDERLNPVVELHGEDVTVTCCYWTDWGGLVRTMFLGRLHDNRLLYVHDEDEWEDDEEQRHEVLFAYDCGILF